ncbi:MAG TPA: GNAT family N-acetyltransferase [Arthrobacter sp.]|nr:GNAT family N-acetyltransferase [Arthrobacter sp.]
MTDLAITAVRIPPTPDGGDPGGEVSQDGAAGFHACQALREAHEREKWGNLDRCPAPAEAMEFWRGNEYEERHLYIATLNGATVGLCSVTLPLRENTSTAGIDVLVAPAFRRRGWGRRLLEYAESVAAGRGRRSLDAYCEIPPEQMEHSGRLLPAKSGAGGLPWGEASTAFAASAGYELEQVERSGRLALPVPSERLETLETEASAHALAYKMVAWAEECPEVFVAEYAALKARMSTDVPTAGLDWGTEDWDAARVREAERSLVRGHGQALVAAAVHGTSGRLAAYTVLNWRPEVPSSMIQQDTLVSAEHRGHRLGMLVKLANLRLAQQRWPAARSVLTWNASENQHMLAINISLGFKPAGYEGEWQKRLG